VAVAVAVAVAIAVAVARSRSRRSMGWMITDGARAGAAVRCRHPPRVGSRRRCAASRPPPSPDRRRPCGPAHPARAASHGQMPGAVAECDKRRRRPTTGYAPLTAGPMLPRMHRANPIHRALAGLALPALLAGLSGCGGGGEPAAAPAPAPVAAAPAPPPAPVPAPAPMPVAAPAPAPAPGSAPRRRVMSGRPGARTSPPGRPPSTA